MNNQNNYIRIVEVGPRDGLQNESINIDSSHKVAFIKNLIAAGVKDIEITSFVKPGKIPQLSDAKKVSSAILGEFSTADINCFALIPNMIGMNNAIEVGIKHAAVFTATSETFNKKNINASIDESLTRIHAVTESAQKNNISIRGYISTVFGCPYEGDTSFDTLCNITEKLLEFGATDISLGDTIGVANPQQVSELIEKLKKRFDLALFTMHFHDTWGMAIANALASVNAGIRSFDSSAAGLGGCPYAKGATGNVATEDLVHLFHSLGYKTGIDEEKLMLASQDILNILGKSSLSKTHQALNTKYRSK